MYRVSLRDFEGPLDLLLFFIRRDELDIYDIPIARIADEFQEHVKGIDGIDLDGAADFIYMAALLISIKARMLLPAQGGEEEDEPLDPRQELVERLLEYIRYKEAAGELMDRHEHRAQQFTRPQAATEIPRNEEITLQVSLYDLIASLGRILRVLPEEPVHTIVRLEYSIEEQQDFVLSRLADTRTGFRTLITEQTKSFVIATFLAVMELARQGKIWIELDRSRSTFFLKLRKPTSEAG